MRTAPLLVMLCVLSTALMVTAAKEEKLRQGEVEDVEDEDFDDDAGGGKHNNAGKGGWLSRMFNLQKSKSKSESKSKSNKYDKDKGRKCQDFDDDDEDDNNKNLFRGYSLRMNNQVKCRGRGTFKEPMCWRNNCGKSRACKNQRKKECLCNRGWKGEDCETADVPVIATPPAPTFAPITPEPPTPVPPGVICLGTRCRPVPVPPTPPPPTPQPPTPTPPTPSPPTPIPPTPSPPTPVPPTPSPPTPVPPTPVPPTPVPPTPSPPTPVPPTPQPPTPVPPTPVPPTPAPPTPAPTPNPPGITPAPPTPEPPTPLPPTPVPPTPVPPTPVPPTPVPPTPVPPTPVPPTPVPPTPIPPTPVPPTPVPPTPVPPTPIPPTPIPPTPSPPTPAPTPLPPGVTAAPPTPSPPTPEPPTPVPPTPEPPTPAPTPLPPGATFAPPTPQPPTPSPPTAQPSTAIPPTPQPTFTPVPFTPVPSTSTTPAPPTPTPAPATPEPPGATPEPTMAPVPAAQVNCQLDYSCPAELANDTVVTQPAAPIDARSGMTLSSTVLNAFLISEQWSDESVDSAVIQTRAQYFATRPKRFEGDWASDVATFLIDAINLAIQIVTGEVAIMSEYTIVLENRTLAPGWSLDPQFQTDLDALPNTYAADEAGYQAFLDKYGTHVITRVQYGARLRREGDFADCDEIFASIDNATDNMLAFATEGTRAPHDFITGTAGGPSQAVLNQVGVEQWRLWVNSSNQVALTVEVMPIFNDTIVVDPNKQDALQEAVADRKPFEWPDLSSIVCTLHKALTALVIGLIVAGVVVFVIGASLGIFMVARYLCCIEPEDAKAKKGLFGMFKKKA